jgi:type I restriction enzyme S subunit
MNLNQYSISAAQPGLSVETISALKIPYAPLIEQQAIAGFLDRETAKLDDLIGKKRTLIDALQEKRSALISRTVTRGLPPAAAQAAGLDPHPPMKPSGIDWLGEVPAHWEILVYKRLCDRIDVGIAEAATHAYTTDGGVPIIRSTNVKPNRLDTTDILRIDRDFAEKQKSKVLKAGDLVTVRTGYPGTTAVIPLEYDQSQCFTLVISTPRKTESPKFLSYYFNAFPGTSQFEREGWGAAQVNISVPIVQNLLVFRPSFSEQEAIANFLDVETAKIDKMIATIETAIEKLQEYRAALINAAVTGKIDVRKFASH